MTLSSRHMKATDILCSIRDLSGRNLQWQNDHEELLANRKRRFYYALDADVFSMFLEPETSGYHSADVFYRSRNVPAQVPGLPRSEPPLLTVEDETAQILARLLSDFLFLDTPSDEAGPGPGPGPQKAYILVPPHNHEVANIMKAIANRAETAASKLSSQGEVVWSQLASVFDHYKRSNKTSEDRDKLAQELVSRAPQVIRLYSTIINAATAMGRFMLLPQGKFTHYPHYDSSEDARVVQTLDAELASHLDSQTSPWFAQLAKFRSSDGMSAEQGRNTENDAKVLATLDFVNQRLHGAGEKMLLITASPYMYRALSAFCPPDRNYNSGGEGFGSLFLRHPQWMMSHPEFFRIGPSSETDISLTRWLEMLPEEDNVASKLSGAAGRDLRPIPNEWNSLVRLHATRKYGESVSSPQASASLTQQDLSPRVMDTLLNIIDNDQWKKDNLEDLLKKPATDSLSKLYTTSTFLGLVDSPGERAGTNRAMPALSFDSPYDDFNQYYTELRMVLRKGLGRKQADVDEVHRMLDVIGKTSKDITYYHRHVIHAAAYAMVEQWGPVLTLCKLAISIADDVIGSGKRGPDLDVVKGREAAFLAAIATRRDANRLADLRDAEDFLQLAIARDGRDHNRIDIRFDSEDYSIRTRRIYFRYYVENHGNIWDKAKKLISQIETFIDKVQRAQEEGRGIGNYSDRVAPLVVDWVLLQSYTNLFGLLMIGLHLRTVVTIESSRVQTLDRFAVFLRRLDAETGLYDPYASTVLQLAQLANGQISKVYAREVCLQIRERLSKVMGTNPPYVQHRRKTFEELVDRYTEVE